MSNTSIRLIVGLGNIGDAYKGTRHNAGFHFVDEVANEYGARFQADRKFFGDVAKARIGGVEVILLKPSTLMNLSGKAVAAVSAFYKITPSEILVAHDELDLLPGTARLKIGGGSAGHNGLKSIVSCLGSSDFVRLRIGIGHPRDRQLQIPVADYVLSRPPKEDQELISSAIKKALREIFPVLCQFLMKKRILVSSCLLGCKVRYDKTSKPLPKEQLIALEEKFNLVGVCPEVLGGLPCPRQPAEISRDREVLTQSGQVLSTFFLKGAHEALNICKNYGIQLAVLKSKSPSCGFGKIYDGTFSGCLINGNGITSDLLLKNGVKVINESELDAWLKTVKE